jgi:uncharacterized protein YfeS
MRDSSHYEEDEPELSPENYPKGARFLKEEFYWSCFDENSPFGNDGGADAFSFFQDWRKENPTANPVEFLDRFLECFEFTNNYGRASDSAQIKRLLELAARFVFSTANWRQD